jgi:hypothetical protein
MRRRGAWDLAAWDGGEPSARAAFAGAAQGALLGAAAHGALAGAIVVGKAAFGAAAPPSASEFFQAVTVVALSSTLWALLFGAPLLLLLGRLRAAGLPAFALCGALGGLAVVAFSAWAWPPFQLGLAAFLAWYGGASAATIWWRVRASGRARG